MAKIVCTMDVYGKIDEQIAEQMETGTINNENDEKLWRSSFFIVSGWRAAAEEEEAKEKWIH